MTPDVTSPKRRGRPPGSKNRPKDSPPPPAPASPVGSTRASLEADRDRLLALIEVESDPKIVATLQTQINGINRMLLRVTGETAPTDANLIRSPQYARLKADLIAALKKHPAALAAVVDVLDTAER